MSRTIQGVYVAFKHPLHEDDAETIAKAIRCFASVGDVTLDEHDSLAAYTARIRVACEIQDDMLAIIDKLRGRK